MFTVFAVRSLNEQTLHISFSVL